MQNYSFSPLCYAIVHTCRIVSRLQFKRHANVFLLYVLKFTRLSRSIYQCVSISRNDIFEVRTFKKSHNSSSIEFFLLLFFFNEETASHFTILFANVSITAVIVPHVVTLPHTLSARSSVIFWSYRARACGRAMRCLLRVLNVDAIITQRLRHSGRDKRLI